MGYRSEVLIAIPLNKVEEFEQACPDLVAMLDKPYVFNGLDKPPAGKIYRTYWVKWYENDEDYPEVQQWDAWMRKQTPTDYRFVRVGDDSGDIENWGEFGGNAISVYTQTSISAPDPADEVANE